MSNKPPMKGMLPEDARPPPMKVGAIPTTRAECPSHDAPSYAKHTPGPWHVARDYAGSSAVKIINEDGLIVCEGLEWGCFCDGNAPLISAAPDMLEALEIAMEYLPNIELEWAKKARAAIAKARGIES